MKPIKVTEARKDERVISRIPKPDLNLNFNSGKPEKSLEEEKRESPVNHEYDLSSLGGAKTKTIKVI